MIKDLSEKAILKKMIRTYQKRGWSRIAKLYGCGLTGQLRDAALARVYATIKGKCIPENGVIKVLKARPITPHTKVPGKRVMNKCATAGLFVLHENDEKRTMRLWNTSDFVRRMVDEPAAVMRARGGEPLRRRHQL